MNARAAFPAVLPEPGTVVEVTPAMTLDLFRRRFWLAVTEARAMELQPGMWLHGEVRRGDGRPARAGHRIVPIYTEQPPRPAPPAEDHR